MSCMRGLYALTAKTSKRLSTASGKTMMANLPLPECAKSINQLYVLVVCILMIVQDSAVTQELHKQHIVAMSWYKERPLHSVSCIELLLASSKALNILQISFFEI